MNIAVCGYPRSGSTMFYNMLRATVQGYTFFDRERSALQCMDAPEPWISKKPSDCFYRDEILEADPDIRFIVTIRDPRSVICSRHASTGSLYKVSWDHTIFGTPRQNRIRRRRKPKPGDYQGHWGLLQWDRAIDDLPDPVVVRYEDLVTFPHEVQWRLSKEFGWETKGRFSAFHEAPIPPGLAKQLNGVRPVEQSRIESWRDHAERIKQQFKVCPLLHDIVIRRGYEQNSDWIKCL